MATSSTELYTRFAGYSRSPVSRQLALLVGLAASIALGIGLVQWAMAPDYRPLYGANSTEDVGALIATLDSNGIPYRLDARSGLVTVAGDQVHRARLLLASEGFPRGGGVGFESLYREQELGVSSFMEQARYHRALEEELARTIAALDSVRGARVHLAMARQSAFLRQRQEPAASIVLHLYPGQALSDRQLAGIVHLVSASVPNLQAAAVSVVDQQGRLLSSQDREEDLGYTQEQYRVAQMLEQRYSDRIMGLLEPILGPGRVRAQVSADIDFTRVERTSEQFAPDGVVRSEQTAEEISVRPLPGGVPGTLSNQPPAETAVLATVDIEAEESVATTPTNSSRRATRNFEVDKTISHIRETPGGVRRLSVAVVVDYGQAVAEDGSVGRVPLEAERLDEIARLTREAVGFSEARGDTLSVINASFVEPPALEVPEGPSLLQQDWIWPVVKTVLAVAGVAALLLIVLRPLLKFSLAPLPPGAPALAGPGGVAMRRDGATGDGMELGDDQLTLAGQARYALPGAGYQQQLQVARTVAEDEPQRAAYVMKDWVGRDG